SSSARRSRRSVMLSIVNLTLVPVRCNMSCGNATAAVRSKGTRPTSAMSAIVTRPSAMNAYQALSRLDKLHPQAPGRLHYGGQAEAHDVRVAALDLGHVRRAQTLYRVPAGLVQALSRPNVTVYLAVGESPEPHARPHDAPRSEERRVGK